MKTSLVLTFKLEYLKFMFGNWLFLLNLSIEYSVNLKLHSTSWLKRPTCPCLAAFFGSFSLYFSKMHFKLQVLKAQVALELSAVCQPSCCVAAQMQLRFLGGGPI